jgi:hypothetical protein
MSAAAAAGQIAQALQNPLAFEPGATRALAEVTLAEEFQNVARGTALAAIARPAGLVLRPAQQGSGIEYRLERPRAGAEVWPIGWPPKGRKNDAMPALFEILNAEITQIPVSEALAAIEPRLKVPFLFDRNALALHGIDPATVPAELPRQRACRPSLRESHR